MQNLDVLLGTSFMQNLDILLGTSFMQNVDFVRQLFFQSDEILFMFDDGIWSTNISRITFQGSVFISIHYTYIEIFLLLENP